LERRAAPYFLNGCSENLQLAGATPSRSLPSGRPPAHLAFTPNVKSLPFARDKKTAVRMDIETELVTTP